MIEFQVSAGAIRVLMKEYNAGVVYVARQRRIVHPHGKFDSGGRWYPNNSEYRACCDQIRSPSRRWPYSLMLHCRTAKHVAAMFSVTQKDVRREAKAFTNIGEQALADHAKRALGLAGADAEG